MDPNQSLLGLPLSQVAEAVLPFRSRDYVDKLLAKLSEEGMTESSEFAKVSKQGIEMQLTGHKNFNLREVADCASMRVAIGKSSQEGDGGTGGSGTQRRMRSRSPRNSCTQRAGRGSGGKGAGNDRASSASGGGNRSRGGQKGGGGGRRGASSRGRPTGEGGGDGGAAGAGGEDTKPELWEAVEFGDEARVLSLLQQGSDPEEKFQGWTPLMKAAEEDRLDIARLLIDRNANVEASNRKGRTPLSFAAAPSMRDKDRRETACQVLRLLLEHGADPNKKDVTRCTPRDRAAREQRDEAIDIFEEFELRKQ